MQHMEEKTVSPPEEIKQHLNFRDKDGRIYTLTPSTYKHIKRDHSITNPCAFIEDTLFKPFAIVEDKTKHDRWIYHKDYTSKLFKVVVACTRERRIKTAFVSDEVKGGVPIWIDKKNLIK